MLCTDYANMASNRTIRPRMFGFETARLVDAVLALLRARIKLHRRPTAPDSLREFQPFADKFVAIWTAMATLQPYNALEMRRAFGGQGVAAWKLAIYIKHHPALVQEKLFNKVYCEDAVKYPRPFMSQATCARLVAGLNGNVDAFDMFVEYRPLHVVEMRFMISECIKLSYANRNVDACLRIVQCIMARLPPPTQARAYTENVTLRTHDITTMEAECPVCYTAPTPSCGVVCCNTCNNFMCDACASKWKEAAKGRSVPCPMCRATLFAVR